MGVDLHTDPGVQEVFERYPQEVRPKMMALREMVLSVARETDGISAIEETLKWGEPSYITKHGSTLRIDWKQKNPNQYAMYFKCTSKLVGTFSVVFDDLFNYEGSRAIVFKMDEEVPTEELKRCIKAALTYHKVKNQPLLGM